MKTWSCLGFTASVYFMGKLGQRIIYIGQILYITNRLRGQREYRVPSKHLPRDFAPLIFQMFFIISRKSCVYVSYINCKAARLMLIKFNVHLFKKNQQGMAMESCRMITTVIEGPYVATKSWFDHLPPCQGVLAYFSPANTYQ